MQKPDLKERPHSQWLEELLRIQDYDKKSPLIYLEDNQNDPKTNHPEINYQNSPSIFGIPIKFIPSTKNPALVPTQSRTEKTPNSLIKEQQSTENIDNSNKKKIQEKALRSSLTTEDVDAGRITLNADYASPILEEEAAELAKKQIFHRNAFEKVIVRLPRHILPHEIDVEVQKDEQYIKSLSANTEGIKKVELPYLNLVNLNTPQLDEHLLQTISKENATISQSRQYAGQKDFTKNFSADKATTKLDYPKEKISHDESYKDYHFREYLMRDQLNHLDGKSSPQHKRSQTMHSNIDSLYSEAHHERRGNIPITAGKLSPQLKTLLNSKIEAENQKKASEVIRAEIESGRRPMNFMNPGIPIQADRPLIVPNQRPLLMENPKRLETQFNDVLKSSQRLDDQNTEAEATATPNSKSASSSTGSQLYMTWGELKKSSHFLNKESSTFQKSTERSPARKTFLEMSSSPKEGRREGELRFQGRDSSLYANSSQSSIPMFVADNDSYLKKSSLIKTPKTNEENLSKPVSSFMLIDDTPRERDADIFFKAEQIHFNNNARQPSFGLERTATKNSNNGLIKRQYSDHDQTIKKSTSRIDLTESTDSKRTVVNSFILQTDKIQETTIDQYSQRDQTAYFHRQGQDYTVDPSIESTKSLSEVSQNALQRPLLINKSLNEITFDGISPDFRPNHSRKPVDLKKSISMINSLNSYEVKVVPRQEKKIFGEDKIDDAQNIRLDLNDKNQNHSLIPAQRMKPQKEEENNYSDTEVLSNKNKDLTALNKNNEVDSEQGASQSMDRTDIGLKVIARELGLDLNQGRLLEVKYKMSQNARAALRTDLKTYSKSPQRSSKPMSLANQHSETANTRNVNHNHTHNNHPLSKSDGKDIYNPDLCFYGKDSSFHVQESTYKPVPFSTNIHRL